MLRSHSSPRFAPVAVTLAGIILAAACTFDSRSDALRCEAVTDCADGRQCLSGWCVDPNAAGDASVADGAVVADAKTGDVDAAMTPPDAAATDAGSACGNTACEPGETAASCPADCGVCTACTGGSCNEDCGGAGVDCAPTCGGAGCDCNIDCTDVNRCSATCSGGDTCTIDCTNADRCDRNVCTGGAACVIDCTNTNRCRFNECTGGSGTQSCPSNIIVCNRDCP